MTVYDFECVSCTVWLHVPPRGILLDSLNIHRLILFPLLCLSLSFNLGRPNCLSEEGIWFIKDLLGVPLQQQLICTIKCFLIEIVLSIRFEWPQSVFLALLHSNHSADELGGTWNFKGLRFCVKGKATRSYNDLLRRIIIHHLILCWPLFACRYYLQSPEKTLLITSGCWVLVFGKDCALLYIIYLTNLLKADQ